LLAIPTTTEPCLTASAAYSIWNIRPWGELGIVSLVDVLREELGDVQGNGIVIVVVSKHDGSELPE
jgi:hypothetical protein